jgi:hypothetical protein
MGSDREPERYYVLGDTVCGPYRYDEKASSSYMRLVFGDETPHRVMARDREEAIQKAREIEEAE